ncbi:MAG: hypothetical protein ACJA2T_001344, partial [Gammaproteobacteria bacterium]
TRSNSLSLALLKNYDRQNRTLTNASSADPPCTNKIDFLAVSPP